jgi:hypothetical protein
VGGWVGRRDVVRTRFSGYAVSCQPDGTHLLVQGGDKASQWQGGGSRWVGVGWGAGEVLHEGARRARVSRRCVLQVPHAVPCSAMHDKPHRTCVERVPMHRPHGGTGVSEVGVGVLDRLQLSSRLSSMRPLRSPPGPARPAPPSLPLGFIRSARLVWSDTQDMRPWPRVRWKTEHAL